MTSPQVRFGSRSSFILWVAFVLGFLIVLRWPTISQPQELYPDEGQLLAGGLTLRHDPLFWRSVDGATAGPFDYYAMVPAALFPSKLAYPAARVTGALFIGIMLVAAGETIVLICQRPIGRVAILPALAFEALTTSPELLHYSTELLPGALLAVAGWIVARHILQPSRFALGAAALLLGSCPYAKLQSTPIAAGMGLLLVAYELWCKRPRNIALLASAALLPALIIVAVMTAAGQIEHMVIPYFLQNLQYAESGRLPITTVVTQLAKQSVTNGYHAAWFGGLAVFGVIALALTRHIPRSLRVPAAAIVILLAVSVLSILSPGRPYHHYLNFLTLPVTLLSGVAFGLAFAPDAPAAKQQRLILGAFFLCGMGPQLGLWASQRPDPYWEYNHVTTARREPHGRLVDLIRRYSLPGEGLGLWGWRSSLYIETELYHATREAHIFFQFVPGSHRSYYLKRYYDDLVSAAPPVFADAAGPGNFFLTERSLGHEMFPPLRGWIKAHYSLAGDIDGVRVYVRHDRLAQIQQNSLRP